MSQGFLLEILPDFEGYWAVEYVERSTSDIVKFLPERRGRRARVLKKKKPIIKDDNQFHRDECFLKFNVLFVYVFVIIIFFNYGTMWCKNTRNRSYEPQAPRQFNMQPSI